MMLNLHILTVCVLTVFTLTTVALPTNTTTHAPIKVAPINGCMRCMIACVENAAHCTEITDKECPPTTHHVGLPTCGCCPVCYEYLKENAVCNPTCGGKCLPGLICDPTEKKCVPRS